MTGEGTCDPARRAALGIHQGDHGLVGAGHQQLGRGLDIGKARGITGPFASHSLHLWNNDACGATSEGGLNTGWDDASKTPAAAERFGPAWVVPLAKTDGCIKFLAR
ncbi:hypothetical protein, partial [Aeromonas media]|uniref:hypothetical protein n=1 Tax=Aeromonas media TaxID=651 RepID=UPI001F4F4C00